MSKHTPGPWSAVKAPHGPIDVLDPRGRDVVTVYGGGVETESKQANARLIAASPDLLKALKYVRRYLNPEDHDVEYVDDVIDKAEGRGMYAAREGGAS